MLIKSTSLTEAIRVLRRRQLVRRDTSKDEPFSSIHTTVQWNVLLALSKDHEHRWKIFNTSFRLLRRGFPVVSPIDNPELDKWPMFERYVPQVLSL
jgi:hypothetical protein